MRDNGDPMNDLKLQPGQINAYKPKFHPLPGPWAKQQMQGGMKVATPAKQRATTELQKALAAERSRIEASMRQQGIIPGKAIYENPRETQNTLLPTDK